MNIAHTIIPKSDQLNADDLIAGPRTIRITGIDAGSSPEQPVFIRYEGDNGRPYKPCKSMRRVLVALWGSDGSTYVGRKLVLYCDKAVTFGPDTTGGIRISHASDIGGPVEIALTMKRGKRKPFRVDPLPEEKPIDRQSLIDVGESKAREGTAMFRAWWGMLTADARAMIKDLAATEWKALAEQADKKEAA